MTNTAKLLMKGIFPTLAMPAAMAVMLASAMPTLKKRSGHALPKTADLVEPLTSASSTTTSGFSLPYLARDSP